MTLVEILARELDKWPDEACCVTQDGVKDFCSWGKPGAVFKEHAWYSPMGIDCELEMLSGCPDALATDHTTAIITREMWEAERARIEGEKVMQECVEKCEPAKKPKANAEGWIRHRGGKCPVDVGAEIDLRLRCGEELIPASRRASEWNWKHTVGSRDIMAYRLHKPEQQSAKVGKLEIEFNANTEGVRGVIEEMQMQIDQIEGPIKWRDRIHEIDAASKDEEYRHCAAMEAFDKERAELVAKLAAEGLALVERAETSPAEDMSDWRNWRVGDLVTVLDSEHEKELMSGKQYPIVELEGDDYDGEMPAQLKNGGCSWLDLDNMMWHSRPTA